MALGWPFDKRYLRVEVSYYRATGNRVSERQRRDHIERKLVIDSMLIPGDLAAFIICCCRIGNGLMFEFDELREF